MGGTFLLPWNGRHDRMIEKKMNFPFRFSVERIYVADKSKSQTLQCIDCFEYYAVLRNSTEILNNRICTPAGVCEALKLTPVVVRRALHRSTNLDLMSMKYCT